MPPRSQGMNRDPGNRSEVYVALLRGVNVGGHNIKMPDLKGAFDSLGFVQVRTVLASGNVVFEAGEADRGILTHRIEDKLRVTFGYEIAAIIRTFEELQSLFDASPFKRIEVGTQTRLYVTFLSEKPQNALPVPYESTYGGFITLSATGTEVCSVLTLSPTSHTTELMAFLAKTFGKKITTRNWNTIIKILKT